MQISMVSDNDAEVYCYPSIISLGTVIFIRTYLGRLSRVMKLEISIVMNLGVFCRNYDIEEYLGHQHISSEYCNFTWIVDSVTTKG